MFWNYLTSFKLQKINFFIGIASFAYQIKTSNFLHLQLNDIQRDIESLKNLFEKK